jgi:hypothetical protein
MNKVGKRCIGGMSVMCYQCPECKAVLDENEANAGGCFEGIKNDFGGFRFRCCGMYVRQDEIGIKEVEPEPTHTEFAAFYSLEYCDPSTVICHFYSSLAAAFVVADERNLEKLTSAFPIMGVAYREWRCDREGFYNKFMGGKEEGEITDDDDDE